MTTETLTARSVLQKWLGGLEQLAPPTDLFASDAVLKIPFAPEGLPPVTKGRDQITQVFAMLPAMFQKLRFVDLELHDTDDPELALGTGRAALVLANGQDFEQHYVFYLRVREGKITEYREYLDPIRGQVVVSAMG